MGGCIYQILESLSKSCSFYLDQEPGWDVLSHNDLSHIIRVGSRSWSHLITLGPSLGPISHFISVGFSPGAPPPRVSLIDPASKKYFDQKSVRENWIRGTESRSGNCV